MNASPQLEPLSRGRRRFVFVSMMLLFTVLVPLLVLYAIGYRFDFDDPKANFKIVGGLYISAESEGANIYVNNEPVKDMRIFQNAAYIQDVPSGKHEVYVEGEGLYTWVKELPVFSKSVTEAHSFNMPIVPQIRVITRWLDPKTNAGVIFEPLASTTFSLASTSNNLVATTSLATSTYLANNEFTFVASLFASSTSELYESQRARTQNEKDLFTFDRTATTVDTTVATTSKKTQNSILYEKEGEVYVTWNGESRDIPYYYCVNYKKSSSTASLYGLHVQKQLYEQLTGKVDFDSIPRAGETLCRDTIRIDRLQQTVEWFDFMPSNSDLVLMLLTDGLYVVEADDRAWQNTQLLYPGSDLKVVVDGQAIYVYDGDYYLELFTEIAQ
ncbi:hypothetical protein KC845_01060 [Candidatus Kaiserbacteria bacterium]|nr:hypothetical protein [Candidatus Kaiserbacteria bacterium]